MSPVYPLFSFMKDDQSMQVIEDSKVILGRCDPVFVADGEYVFWDANGDGVCVSVSISWIKGTKVSVTSCAAAYPLRDAFRSYAKSQDLAEFDVEGTPLEVWQRIQAELGRRSKKRL